MFTFFSSLKAFMAVSSSPEPGVVLFKIFWKNKDGSEGVSHVGGGKITLITYLHQHFKSCDPLKWEDQEGGQRKSLADGVFLQAGQDARETRVVLPESKNASVFQEFLIKMK